jgi:hypothetical protein
MDSLILLTIFLLIFAPPFGVALGVFLALSALSAYALECGWFDIDTEDRSDNDGQ